MAKEIRHAPVVAGKVYETEYEATDNQPLFEPNNGE